MKLVYPTDFEILGFLAEEGRNNAVNIAVGLDRDRSYINTRLRTLADKDLVERVGPAERSGLYEISERGEAAVEYEAAYREEDVDFGAVIEDAIDGE
ncbi:MAG: winged helix-turn-helix transcriptional regulator [Halobacteriota archaeon]